VPVHSPGSYPLFVSRLRDPFRSKAPLDPLALALIALFVFALVGDAFGQTAYGVGIGKSLGQFDGMGELGDVTLDHVGLSFVGGSSRNDLISVMPGRLGRSRGERDHCQMDNYLQAVAKPRNLPRWALSEIDPCRPKRSSLDRLIPRISIEGTFFSVGYGVELDKESRGLFIDYGAFTLGIGDSPTGASIFNGATFHLPHWVPGRNLLPDRIRDHVELDVGVRLPLDTINIRKWSPQLGVGVKLAEW
jgi:hypothetical protein